MKSKFLTSIGLVTTIICLSTTNASAEWKQQPLPGISGSSLPVVAGVVGVAGALVVWGIVHHKHNADKDPIRVPATVNVGPDAETSFKLENRGSSPVQLAEVVLKGYSLVDGPALPVIVRSNQDLELRIRATGAQHRGTVALSILDGKHTRNRVVAIRPGVKNPLSD